MIDFNNASFMKLKDVPKSHFENIISPLLVPSEEIIASFKTARDGVIFTNKRIIAINIQGITGKKKDISSLPYKRIQAFSIETAGTFDLDSELDLWFSGLGRVRFEFKSKADIARICRTISTFAL